METLDTLLRHRSIRKFKADPVSEDILQEILLAASRASTTGNMQVYSIIVTRDPENRKQLWEYHFKQNMVLQAPLLLTFCADFHRFNEWCRQRDAIPGYDNFLSFMTAATDALLAAQNAAVAAEAHGLGICYLGTTIYNAKKFIDFFNLPEQVVPITTLVIGYPDENPDITDRLPLEAIVHKEHYHAPDKSDIDGFYAGKEALALTAELLKENQLETLAQIFTTKRYTLKDNRFFSGTFLEVLSGQKFMNNE